MLAGVTKIIFDNNYPIYLLVYLIIPILLLYKVKIHTYNDAFLSKKNTDILKGLCILVIIFHHVSKAMPLPGLLSPFQNFGYLGVSIFFFLSGYGLIFSSLRKSDYFKDFFSKRISRVLIPYITLNLIVLGIEYLFFNKVYSYTDIILYAIGIKMIDSAMWYINATVLLYIAFFLSFRYLSGKHAIVVLFGYTLIYCATCTGLHLDSYWHNAIFCFPIGVYIGRNYCTFERSINKIVKHYWLAIIGIWIPFLVLYLINNTSFGHKYYFTGSSTIASIFFVFFIISLLIKIQFNSIAIGLVGSLSYEMYLVHMKVLSVYFKTFNGNNIFVYILLVILVSLILKEIVKSVQKLRLPLITKIRNSVLANKVE